MMIVIHLEEDSHLLCKVIDLAIKVPDASINQQALHQILAVLWQDRQSHSIFLSIGSFHHESQVKLVHRVEEIGKASVSFELLLDFSNTSQYLFIEFHSRDRRVQEKRDLNYDLVQAAKYFGMMIHHPCFFTFTVGLLCKLGNESIVFWMKVKML